MNTRVTPGSVLLAALLLAQTGRVRRRRRRGPASTGRSSAASAPAGVDERPPRAGRPGTSTKKQGGALEDADPRPRPLQPGRLGRHASTSRRRSAARRTPGLQGRLYGDIEPVQDDTPHEWRVYALDKKTGAIRWQKTVLTGVPKIKRHTKATHANSTLATDGERIIAFFGSEGLYAFDMKGKQLWKKDLGVLDAGYYMVPDAQWETGSSPILHDGVVVVQADVQKGSFIAAFDAKDGKRAVAR